MMFGGGSGHGGGSRDSENFGYGGSGGGSFSHHQMMPPPLPHHHRSTASIPSAASVGTGFGGDDELPRRDERIPQWSNQETREFIAIRAGMAGDISAAKRSNSKALWEVAAAKMKDLGYRRTAEQCKCKWKNLVNRYRGMETSYPDGGKQCPFFEELYAVLKANDNTIQQFEPESEVVRQQVGKRGRSADRSSEEFSVEDAEKECKSEGGGEATGPKPKAPKEKRPRLTTTEKRSKHRGNQSTLEGIQDIFSNFIQHQMRSEMQWRESMEKCAVEREAFQREWRETMRKLEEDRVVFEQAWREREERRKMKEESRAEKRDALLTILLNKLINE
ncbi:unnamed protein product [Cuscuta campestris]|uniref:Myb-like domain-containing protein n=1 Tax=Cuscuta campestris TaxID=132261 RepID=A0A484N1S5_9ASTE|nr:unnamed protein product [Cuscuta campestris]